MSGEGISRARGHCSIGEGGVLGSSSTTAAFLASPLVGGRGWSTSVEKKSERTQRFLAGLEGLRLITTPSIWGETRDSLSTGSLGRVSGGVVTTSGGEQGQGAGGQEELGAGGRRGGKVGLQ